MDSKLTVKDFKNLICRELNSIYSLKEILSIYSILLENRVNISKVEAALYPEKVIESQQLLEDLKRLKKAEPIQYIVGVAPFRNLELRVTPDTLIPRPETEELVELIVSDPTLNKRNHLQILDIGTGTGAIAISLKQKFPEADLYATDFSIRALQVAKANAEKYRLKVNWIHHDILRDPVEILPQSVDLIVSNPPYIPELNAPMLHANVTQYEPHSALFVPNYDPLLFYKRIIDIGSIILKPDGKLFFETFEESQESMMQLLKSYKYKNVHFINDINEKFRFLIASL
ncbi:MAG TPA: peptide chain release factor N(5)-glutamine methyltransferase [Bacteroidales bacterium]|nr:peptide chain release factor N(5)-glutamine methyltransferase [Bacteroidales bacterium]HOH23336.1 peptide chain release factor N(5)-glutamine methyltransferase [Bacteroidales bacterium]HPZ03996.1 peptide chain release factor N(5)-glutamine methyltransferase [Bacteroidales bacterium]HQB75639.1 peptide chain release factor N(5)-glutamine methyltransferase [Bacteroidales bacterium]